MSNLPSHGVAEILLASKELGEGHGDWLGKSGERDGRDFGGGAGGGGSKRNVWGIKKKGGGAGVRINQSEAEEKFIHHLFLGTRPPPSHNLHHTTLHTMRY